MRGGGDDRVAIVEAVAECLERQDDLAARAAAARLRAQLDAGAAGAVMRALGLTARGGVSPGHARRLAARDVLLRHARRTCWPPPLRTSVAADGMLGSFDSYYSDRWPRDQAAGRPPAMEPQLTWFRLLSGDHRVPQKKRLVAILDEEIQSSL